MGIFFHKTNKDNVYLLVGLGNPGAKYEKTRHNAGFMAIDSIAEKHGVKVNKLKFKAMMGEAEIAGVRMILLKPQTFMNLSGEAVGDAARFYKIPPERIFVISDDSELDTGVLRIREKGSAGGHNGLKSIVAHLGTENFVRLRIGVGKRTHPDYDLADWVLGELDKASLERLKDTFVKVDAALNILVTGDSKLAMSKYNG
jgi:PTH1 family peptidyl-tRNA hydrolase